MARTFFSSEPLLGQERGLAPELGRAPSMADHPNTPHRKAIAAGRSHSGTTAGTGPSRNAGAGVEQFSTPKGSARGEKTLASGSFGWGRLPGAAQDKGGGGGVKQQENCRSKNPGVAREGQKAVGTGFAQVLVALQATAAEREKVWPGRGRGKGGGQALDQTPRGRIAGDWLTERGPKCATLRADWRFDWTLGGGFEKGRSARHPGLGGQKGKRGGTNQSKAFQKVAAKGAGRASPTRRQIDS